MKKVSALILVLFCAAVSFGQEITNNQSISNAATIYRIKGATKAERAFILPVTTDTILNGIDSVGMMIYVNVGENRGIWYRDTITEEDNDVAYGYRVWNQLVGGSGVDTVYVADDLYVVWDSLGHQVIHRLRNDGLISGGIVTWTGVGLTFSVSPAIYILNQIEYRTLADTITLDPSDPTFGRFDAFIVDTMPGIGKLTGTPSSDPAFPQEEPISQIILSYILINAGDIIPTSITSKAIYNENIEWAHVNSGTITADFDNLDYPAAGVKSAYVSSYENNAKINFIYSDSAEDGTITVDSNAVLSMYIYSNGEFPLTNRLHWRWFLDDIPVSNHVTLGGSTDRYGFSSRDSNTYQIVGIPLTAWTWTQSTFNRLVLTMTGTDNSGAKGFYLDVLQLQKGVVIVPPPNDFSNKLDSVTITKTTVGTDTTNVFKTYVKGISKTIGTVWTGGGGSVYTADNGLTMAANNVKLGGTALGANTDIPTSAFSFTMASSNTAHTLRSTNSSSGIGGDFTSSSGSAIIGTSSSSFGGQFISTTGVGGISNVSPSSTNTVVESFRVARFSSGTAANGIGGSLDFYVKNSTAQLVVTNRLLSKWTDVTSATRTSQFIIDGVNNGTQADLFTLSGNGAIRGNKYGVGSFVSGTPAYNIVVDASGNFMESLTPFGGTVYTASNGLTMASNNTKLGGTLSDATTTVSLSTNDLYIKRTNNTGLYFYNSADNVVELTSKYDATHYAGLTFASDATSTNSNVFLYARGGGTATSILIEPADIQLIAPLVTVSSLAGTGSRTVLADASGTLSAPVSDQRLKKNITPVSKYVDVLGLLKDEKKRGVFYNWKDTKRGTAQEIGFVAQGFEDIKGMTGTMNNTGYKYMNYDRVTAILWEQNRLLLERIEALEKILNELLKK